MISALLVALTLSAAHTPGVVRPLTVQQICSTKWGTDRRHVSEAMKRQVFAAYHIDWSTHADYEVDHLVPRELGGADDVANLWPQRWAGPWNARMKDRLENRLHAMVCKGELALRTAQGMIRSDWRDAYRRYVVRKPDAR